MIFVEGKPDKILLRSIGIAGKSIYIEGSKGNVCNRLKKNRHARGLVDEDPESAQPSYINALIKESEDQNLIEYFDRTNSNKLIVIKPYLEEWVINSCRKFEIDITSYFLPQSSKELKKVINNRLDKFHNLISSNAEIAALKKLKEFINS